MTNRAVAGRHISIDPVSYFAATRLGQVAVFDPWGSRRLAPQATIFRRSAAVFRRKERDFVARRNSIEKMRNFKTDASG